MKIKLLASLALILPLSAQADVTVEWISPENYTDAWSSSVHSDKSRQITLEQLQRFIEQTASAMLPDGQNLNLQVTQLDLEGEFEPWRVNSQNVRIVKSPYFALIAFDYKITDANGNVIKEGSENLQNDLLVAPGIPDATESASYTRSTLRNWMAGTLR